MLQSTRHWIATLRPCAEIPAALAPRIGLALRIATLRASLTQPAPAPAPVPQVADMELPPEPVAEILPPQPSPPPPPRKAPKKAVFAAVSLDDAASLLSAFGAPPENPPAPQSESMGPPE